MNIIVNKIPVNAIPAPFALAGIITTPDGNPRCGLLTFSPDGACAHLPYTCG